MVNNRRNNHNDWNYDYHDHYHDSLFILPFYFEKNKLARRHNPLESEEMQLFDTSLASALIFFNVVGLVFLWANTLVPIPILHSQELFLPTLMFYGLILGGNFEILGESTAKFLFFRE